MLAQLVLGIVMTVKALGVSTPDEARDAIKWTEYFFLANVGATAVMCIGVTRAIPELKRAGLEIGKLVTAAIGFAIATFAMLWCYRVLSHFIEVMLDPEAGVGALGSAIADLETMRYVAIAKDFAYAFALVSLIGTVQRSAVANDQLALRDYAGSMNRALVVMLLADLFYQLAHGNEGGGGILTLVGSLLVGIYWIYCHVRLQRFLANSAYFMNEPHNLPVAKVVSAPDAAPRPRVSQYCGNRSRRCRARRSPSWLARRNRRSRSLRRARCSRRRPRRSRSSRPLRARNRRARRARAETATETSRVFFADRFVACAHDVCRPGALFGLVLLVARRRRRT